MSSCFRTKSQEIQYLVKTMLKHDVDKINLTSRSIASQNPTNFSHIMPPESVYYSTNEKKVAFQTRKGRQIYLTT